MADVPVRLKTTYDDKGTKAAKKDFKGIEKSVKNLGAGIVAAFGTQQLIEFGRQSINLAREQALAEAQLAQVIESTGSAAGVTSEEMRELASRLQDVTNFGDEATIAAQALLLTFTNIGADVLPQTTATVLDMSQALGQSLKSSAIQLGKALNDPVKGITALSRVGVSFTEEQKELIESLVETGKVAEAQGVILAELNKEFGGSAAAAREASGGSIALTNAYGDLQEQAGFLLGDLLGLNDGMEDQIAIVDVTASRVATWRGNLDLIGTTIDRVGVNLDEFNRKVFEGEKAIANFFLPGVGGAALDAFVEEGQKFVDEVGVRSDEIIEAQEEAAVEQEAVAEATGATIVQIGQETNEELEGLQRDLAADLIDIQRDSEDDRIDQVEKFADKSADLSRDHAESITDIQKDAAKERARIDKDLAKRLSKDTTTSQKRIRKEQEKFAKDDKNQRRREAVNTLGDQRLFDFQLRKLARDGQATAIQDALEQRRIEEEIAREKGQVESQIERESRKDTIDTIREEAAARRDQLQADATEEKQLFEEGLAEELAAEQASFTQRSADLDRFNQEAIQEINESEAERIAAVGEGLAEIEGLTVENFDTLLGVAEAAGPAIGAALADGMTQGFMDNFDISQLAGTDTISPSNQRGPIGTGSAFTPGFQDGGEFIVGGTGGPDSQLVQFAASPGERVTISNDGNGGGGNSLTINFNGPVSDPTMFAGMIQSAFDSFADSIGA